MALGTLDRADARIKRRIARGTTPEMLRAARKSKKATYKREIAPFQKRIDAYHAALVAAGMSSDFPTMPEWEKEHSK